MNIYESIAEVQKKIDFIGKDKKAEKQNYKYRGVDQVLNALHPVFAECRVFAVPNVLETVVREWRSTKSGGDVVYQILKVQYRFYAEDGSYIEAIVYGEAMDSGDKVSNKCMSVAYKYACFQILSIPTEETTADPDDKHEEFTSGAFFLPMVDGDASQREKKCGITLSELRDFGVEDVGKMAKWLSEKCGKPITEFNAEETKAAWEVLKRNRDKKQLRQMREGLAPTPHDEEGGEK